MAKSLNGRGKKKFLQATEFHLFPKCPKNCYKHHGMTDSLKTLKRLKKNLVNNKLQRMHNYRMNNFPRTQQN